MLYSVAGLAFDGNITEVGENMANSVSRYTDASVVIYDKDDNLITQTNITGHDKNEMYVEVSEGLENIKPGTRLNLVIIHPEGAHKYSGMLRRARKGVYEISIFGERTRAARRATRYQLCANASITDIIVDSEPMTLSEPIQVTIEDISKTGILFKSPDLRFIIDVEVQMEVNIKGKDSILKAKIMREQEDANGVFSFGCELIFSE